MISHVLHAIAGRLPILAHHLSDQAVQWGLSLLVQWAVGQ